MKKSLVFILLIMSLVLNAQIIFNIKDDVTEDASLTLSPAIQFDYNKTTESLYKFQINIFDNDLLYTENKIFGRTIKVKKGFRYFDFFINIPLNNSQFGMGYEERKKDSLFGVLNTLKFSRTEVFTGGYSKLNYNLYEFFIPTYVKGAAFGVNNDTNNFMKLNVQLQRWFKIPMRIDISDDYSLSLKIVNFDKYNNEGMGIGISYEDGFFPIFFTDFPLSLFDQDLLIGLKAELKNDFGYEIYLVNKNLNIPMIFMMDEDSGGIFFEF
ncbi:MAG: hypothetical protein ACQESN_00370 [Thermotogota bacterium]